MRSGCWRRGGQGRGRQGAVTAQGTQPREVQGTLTAPKGGPTASPTSRRVMGGIVSPKDGEVLSPAPMNVTSLRNAVFVDDQVKMRPLGGGGF